MALPQMLTVAVLLWTLGASVYTWELWKARGLTDNGFLGLAALMTGSLTMTWAMDAHPVLRLCAALPGFLAAAIMGHKLWFRLMNLLRRQSRDRERALESERPDPLEWQSPASWGSFTATMEEARQDARLTPVPMIDATAEEDRSRRLGKMFG